LPCSTLSRMIPSKICGNYLCHPHSWPYHRSKTADITDIKWLTKLIVSGVPIITDAAVTSMAILLIKLSWPLMILDRGISVNVMDLSSTVTWTMAGSRHARDSMWLKNRYNRYNRYKMTYQVGPPVSDVHYSILISHTHSKCVCRKW